MKYGRIPPEEFKRVLAEFAENRRTRAARAAAWAKKFPGLVAAASVGEARRTENAENDDSGTDMDIMEGL